MNQKLLKSKERGASKRINVALNYVVHLLVLVYSACMVWLYIQNIFFQRDNILHFYQLTLKSHGLLLLYFFCYLTGSALFFINRSRQTSSVIISFGSIGFILGAILDCLTKRSFESSFYLLYIGLHSIVLFVTVRRLQYNNSIVIGLTMGLISICLVNLFLLKGYFL